STATPYADPWYASAASEEVTANDAYIEDYARRQSVDPDFVRAIVWMESTHGWLDRLSPEPKSLRPMNVHVSFWQDLGVSRVQLEDRETNVAVGTYLIGQLWSRIDAATPAKVATLYNNLFADSVTGYGKTVALYYARRPWRQVPAKPSR